MAALEECELPTDLVEHLDDESRDEQIQAETDEALALTGKDVGTPILHIAPPEGAAFFGPVISPAALGGGRRPGCGTTSSVSRRSPVSPSSSAACARSRSCARSAWPTATSACRRTGTAAVAGRRSSRVGAPWVWGATAEEVLRDYPADDLLAPHARALTRAITVRAPVETSWRWLCQLALAPYSYDLIDNLGRRSPRALVPGADELVLGQRMAGVFTLTSFDAPRQWTGLARAWCAVTYAAEPDPHGSRIVSRMVVEASAPVTWALAWGDLVMMRKQLRTLRDLAETSTSAAVRDSSHGDLPNP